MSRNTKYLKSYIMQAWQNCPKCNGEGYVHDPHCTTSAPIKECNLCKGRMIISTVTGLPPEGRTTVTLNGSDLIGVIKRSQRGSEIGHSSYPEPYED